MRYGDLLTLYFERSNAIQSYWTLYVVVIGGLVAVSAIREEPDRLGGFLATVLFCAFAYKNLDGIRDASVNRCATLAAIRQYSGEDAMSVLRASVEPTLNPPALEAVRNFHVFCDGMTVVTIWAMQFRRRRAYHPQPLGVPTC